MARCKVCGGAIRARTEKLKVVAGTTAMIAATGALLATPIGWLALLGAACTPQVATMIRMKCLAGKASEQAGTYFECGDCGQQIGVGEALGF